jgi:hypothetical protein
MWGNVTCNILLKWFEVYLDCATETTYLQCCGLGVEKRFEILNADIHRQYLSKIIPTAEFIQ